MSQATCYNCSKSIDSVVLDGNRVSRNEYCPACQSDLHCCYQCNHYDSSAYNECRESQAERVVDKGKANFCDYYSLSATPITSSKKGALDSKKKAFDDLEKLFQ